MKDRTSENNPQRTDDKNSISLKIVINIMKDIPILQRQVEKWQSKSDTVTKVPQQTSPTLNFQSENLLSISFSTMHTRAHRRKRGKNRVHKQEIKLPLYKNRSLQVFSSFFFFHFHLNIIFLSTQHRKQWLCHELSFSWLHCLNTIAKQHIYLRV